MKSAACTFGLNDPHFGQRGIGDTGNPSSFIEECFAMAHKIKSDFHYNFLRWFFLTIVSVLGLIFKAFAESCRKGWLFIVLIQMREIAEGLNPEGGNPLLSFFAVYDCNAGRRSDEPMP